MTKFAFVFPGQGSQAVGMLNSFADNAIVKATVAEASDALQFDLGKLITRGSKKDLDLTANTQPIMLTVAIAFYRAWLVAGGKIPSIVAGHSLGEYTALVAAGAIAFEDAVPLVRFRAQVMQEAVPVGQGSMAAILGLSDEEVRIICDEAAEQDIVEAVNFNVPAQVVIAGHRAAVIRACNIAKTKGAKRTLILSVSAPFHSSLLKSASKSLSTYLSTVFMSTPKFPVINNVDVAILNEPTAIKEALVRQATNPVRWVETIQKMSTEGVRYVIECGPGKVLTSFTKRITNKLIGDAIFDRASLDKIIELLK